MRCITEQDPVQDTLEKSKKTTYFKLTLPNTVNKLKVAIWASGTPKQFLLHVHTAVHVCKQIGLDTNYANAAMGLEAVYCVLDAAKTEYAQLAKATKKKAKDQKEKGVNPDPDVNATSSPLAAAKTACNEAATKVKEAKLAIMMEGAKPFKIFGNLLSNEARQPWEKVIKAQVMKAPWEDVFGNTHTKTATKTWDSFHNCIMFHLQMVF